MCNHLMVQEFDGQTYCVQCNEEIDSDTFESLYTKELPDFDHRIDEDDDSSEEAMRENDMLEAQENSYADYMAGE